MVFSVGFLWFFLWVFSLAFPYGFSGDFLAGFSRWLFFVVFSKVSDKPAVSVYQ